MALVFPLAMPLLGPAECRLTIDRADFVSREGSGRLGGVQAGWPLWSGEWVLGRALTVAMSDDWLAFLDALDGAQRRFLGRDFTRPRPLAYLTSGLPGGFDGAASSWSQAIGGDGQASLTLSGLPAGLVLSKGDYVDFRWTSGGEARRTMTRLVESGVANGLGAVTLGCRPALHAVTPEGAVAHLDEPACLMRLDPRQTSIGGKDRRHVAGARIVGLQDLAP